MKSQGAADLKTGLLNIVGGAITLAGASILSAISYSNADAGQTYALFAAAILAGIGWAVVGAFQAIRALTKFNEPFMSEKDKQVLKRFERENLTRLNTDKHAQALLIAANENGGCSSSDAEVVNRILKDRHGWINMHHRHVLKAAESNRSGADNKTLQRYLVSIRNELSDVERDALVNDLERFQRESGKPLETLDEATFALTE